ncbi:PREDICTED: alpha carbonic anhydrase 7-like [Nelumbo nucifera]|uniref:Alpha carbonic anhydrase 7-like n=1 Tax=Nelumbo nucifera TaxID=4432 RepID=A0A1U7Z6U8_NELNU|nr:PREDICTED: alpha carbonic anhydrase 7-like [Nelumbo nucifera]
MKSPGKPMSTFGLVCLLLLIFNTEAATFHEVEDEREFDYLEGSGKGPDHWGELHEEWAACKNGDMQSPIDLLNERVQLVPGLGRLKRSYKPSNAILKNRGHDIAFLSELKKGIWSIADSKNEVGVGVVDPRHIKIGSRKYYRYMGSLTVPPCTQGVIWTINTKVRTVSKDQVKALRDAVHDYAEQNARPLQPLNNREIHLYRPQDLTRDRRN